MVKPRLFIDGTSGHAQAVRLGSATQIVDGTSASAQSTTFEEETLVRVKAKADVTLACGADPTAIANGPELLDGETEYFRVDAGDKIAVLGGIAKITVMR